MISSGRGHLEYPEKTLYELLAQTAGDCPEACAMDLYGKKIRFGELLREIGRAAQALSACGIGPGDTVTLCMPNLPQTMILFYAASRVGATACMLHPQSAVKEIVFSLRLTGSRLVLTLDQFYETVLTAVQEYAEPVTLVVARAADGLPPVAAAAALLSNRRYGAFPYAGRGILWKEFLRQGAASSPLPPAPFSAGHTAVILSSGGTGGSPKAVALSDLAFNACALQARHAIGTEFGPGLSMLSCMPCFHGFGLGMNLHAALIHGVTCLLMPAFHIRDYAKMLLQKHPNYIAGVPTIFDALLHLPGMEKAVLGFLRGVFCGGDTLPASLKETVDGFLRSHGASVEIREGYGLTECVTASCLTPLSGWHRGSIGLPFPDTDYAIVRPGTEKLLPCGETGEIILTGPSLMQGYLGDPAETEKALRRLPDGRLWLYTGDLGCLDEDGFVYFRGRIKRMIITNGFNVYPSQIEAVLQSCPGVREAAVIGVPDPRRMQKVRAYVVPAEGCAPDAASRAAIQEHLQTWIARYALPREIVFLPALPRTDVGKVDIRALEQYDESLPV